MRIKKIVLNNFKFHKNIEFDIKNKNCLIYGENGTGKSSIYEALYSIFKTYFRNKSFDLNKFQRNNSTENLNSKIVLTNDNELVIPNENYDLSELIDIENKKTIYFSNQDLLESLVGYENNFYIIIKNHLKKYFETLNTFCEIFDSINTIINSSNYQEENTKRQTNIEQIKLFFKKIELKANDIINKHFEEEFQISFEYDWGLSNTEDDYKYQNPKIALKIDDKDNLKINFNEAKLKLASIAIFFALIKQEENISNPLKLLVLDDFLTSLDMANRHYIIEYIFNEFADYQKIILTHNLQFYNLIVKLLKFRKEDSWDIKNIYLRNENHAFIYDKGTDYLKQAKVNLASNRLDEAGIYLRKEFERIVEELRQLNEVGAKEKLSKIVDVLLKLDATTDINIKKMQNILKKTKFYQQTILNSAAHDDINNERYTKELNGAIVILIQLNKLLKSIGNNR